MGVLLAIDPGVSRRGRGNAIAVFDGCRLARTLFARASERPEIAADVVVVERPQFDGRTLGAAADVLALAWEGALLAGLIAGANACELRECEPREWKGSAPKPMVHSRAWASLADAERHVLGPSAGGLIEAAVERGARRNWPAKFDAYGSNEIHNTLDAVSIGLWALRRLTK